MKIAKLSVKNFIGIEEISVELKKLTFISGRNGKGKTSIIEAIKAAFQGADASKIRMGANKAEIYLDAGEMQIKRSITPSGGSLQVTREGKVIPKPQSFLDGIVGNFAFEPVKFFMLKAKEQTAYLLKAIPCKVTWHMIKKWVGECPGYQKGDTTPAFTEMHGLEAIGLITKDLYDKRHAVNQRVTTLAASIQELSSTLPSDTPPATDAGRMNEIIGQITEMKAAKQKVEAAKGRMSSLAEDILHLHHQIDSLTTQANAKKKEIESLKDSMLKMDVVDPEPLEKELAVLQDAQSRQREYLRLEGMQEEHKAVAAEAEMLDKAVQTMQKTAPVEVLAGADMPIDGLIYSDGDFYLNGVPMQNLSTSEKARLAVAITRKLNEPFPVKAICLDGFEALDSATQKAFITNTEKDAFQYFITKVGDAEELEVCSK